MMKNKIGRMLGVMLVTLVVSSVSFAENNPIDDKIEAVDGYFATSRILTPEEGQDLVQRVNDLKKEPLQDAQYRHIALATVEKVVKDRTNLEFILIDLNKLVKDKYSQKTGRIKEKDLEKAWQQLRDLRDDLKNSRPKFSKAKSLDKEDYLLILDNHVGYLSGDKALDTPAATWGAYKDAIASARPKWEKKYEELLIKLMQEKAAGKAEDEILSKDEMKFVKVYGRVHALYKLLEGQL